MKILIKQEITKGHIPSDKITYRGVPFESFSLDFFDGNYLKHKKITRMVKNFRKENRMIELIDYLKFFVRRSKKYKLMIKENYHTHIYLNINFDGVDCFISR